MKQQIVTMLELQGDMNTKVHPDWTQQNFEWYKNRDSFDAYLLISFTRKKTGMGRTGEDILKLNIGLKKCIHILKNI